ncbi:MAG TPA: hypothetical protein DDW50_10635 [Firmicutes bacterium]|jgi:hypothetical protein|nr:hypothetical protein [Bacillota bacterium]
MKLILAAWLTLVLAWMWDRFLFLLGPALGIHEKRRVILLVPIGEEVFKYGVSYCSGIFPPVLFAFFGIGEGIYESAHLKHHLDPVLILAGILPHTLFSIFYLFNIPVWLGLFLAIISHSIWNNLFFNFKNDCKRSTD